MSGGAGCGSSGGAPISGARVKDLMSKKKSYYTPGRMQGSKKKGNLTHHMKTSPNWMKDKMKGGKQQ
jgi:hypothetical protein